MENKRLIYVTEPEFIEANFISTNLTTVTHKPHWSYTISLDRSNNLEFINFITNNKCGKFTIYTYYYYLLNGCFIRSIEYKPNNIVNIEIELGIDDIAPITDEVYSQIIARKRAKTINQLLN